MATLWSIAPRLGSPRGAPRRSRRGISCVALAVLTVGFGAAGLGGCERRDAGPHGSSPEASPTASADPAEFRRTAHRRAFEAFVPVAQTALAQLDPLAAEALNIAPLTDFGWDPTARAEVGRAVDRAWTLGAEIDADALPPDRAPFFEVLTFGLSRARTETRLWPPWWRDPTATTTRVRDALDAWIRRPPASLVTRLDATASLLRRGIGDLSATSRAALRGARADLTTIEERLEELRAFAADGAWPDPDPMPPAIAEARARLDAIEPLLDAAQTIAPRASLHPAAAPDRVAVLPDRWGKEELVARLRGFEAIDARPRALLDGLTPLMERLRAMIAKRKATGRSAVRPVDMPRCTALAVRLSEVSRGQPALADASLDCDRLLARRPPAMTDGAFVSWAIREAVVEPARHARRLEEPLSLGLVTGDIAPWSQLHSRTTAIVLALRDDEAAVHALEVTLEAACTAATALWVHADLGDDAGLESWSSALCPGPSSPRRDFVLEHPRDAIATLDLIRLGRGPSATVALDRYWWVPAGLVDRLALPEAPPLPGPNVRVQVEPLGDRTR